VVYQNDWLEPVLCRIEKFGGEEKPFHYQPKPKAAPWKRADFNREVLKFLLARRVPFLDDPDLDVIDWGMDALPLSTQCRIALREALKAAKGGGLDFDRLSGLVADVLDCREAVSEARKKARDDDDDLTRNLRKLVPSGSLEFELAASQCLFRDLSSRQTELQHHFDSWVKNVIGKGGVQ
jgi:hypothetical protein